MTENMTENDTILDELDTSWLTEFENDDNDYHHYYSEDVSYINLNCVYINTNNEIEKVKTEIVIFKTPGILSRDEVLSIIKSNTYSNKDKYSLLSILKFNIDVEPNNINSFLKNNDKNIGDHFLHTIKHIDSIQFNKTISMFQDMNTLTIIFYIRTLVELLSFQSQVERRCLPSTRPFTHNASGQPFTAPTVIPLVI